MNHGDGRLPEGIPNLLSLISYGPEAPIYLFMIVLIHGPAFLFPLSLFLFETQE